MQKRTLSTEVGCENFNIVYSKKNLHFYELACVLTEGNSTSLELHPHFKNKESYLGISKKEIIEHEKVHFLRKNFQGDKYEESIAYMTSSSKFRRMYGAIFRNPTESMAFVVFSSILPVLVVIEMNSFWILISYLGLIFLLFLRLFFTQKALKIVLKKLDSLTDGKGFDALCLLSQEEIDLFSKNDFSESNLHQ